MKAIKNKKGIGFVDTGVKILISVVVGTLLLCGTYGLAKQTVLPNVKGKIESLFDYSENATNNSPAKIRGDVNNDGSVNEIDLQILQNVVSGITVDNGQYNLDINEDGIINAFDVSLLQRLVSSKS